MTGETYFFLFMAVLYAVVVATGGWLVMQSERRRFWRGRLASSLAALQHRVSLPLCGIFRRATQVPSHMRSAAYSGANSLRRHKWTTLATLALLTVPVIIALCLTPHIVLEGYDDLPKETAPVIAALLRGEQLVPPPPLAPEVFVTKEVEAIRQELGGASREWMLLDADFRQRLLAVYQLMAKRGYRMALIEGYRSPERQAMLARLGPQVTNAGAFQSYHQYGLAADNAFYRDGKIIISEKDPWAMEGYRLYGEYAESVGLVWGGRWRMMDFGHVELRRAGMLGSRRTLSNP